MIKNTTARTALILFTCITATTMTVPALAQTVDGDVPSQAINVRDFNINTPAGAAALTRYTHRVIMEVCARGLHSFDPSHAEEMDCRSREFAKADAHIARLREKATNVAQADVAPKPGK